MPTWTTSSPPSSTSNDDAGVLEAAYTVDNGAQPHDAKFYLTTPEAGRPIAESLRAAVAFA